ncbi:MAG: site-specific integrase [Dehalococcoidales bacterium]
MAKGKIVERINKDGSHSWDVIVAYKDNITGKWHHRWKTTDGSRKADTLKTAMLREVDKGDYLKPSKETIANFMQFWIDGYRPNITARSYDRYSGIVKGHIIPSIGKIPLAQLTPQHIQKMYTDKLAAGLSPRSVRYIHVVLHRALQTAIKWHKLTINPADNVDIPKAPHTDMQIWNESEVIQFLETARSTPYHCLFYLAIFSGARRGELLALRWQDVDLTTGQLSISRSVQHVNGEYVFSQPKTEKSRRTIALPKSATLLLKQLREATEHSRSRMGEKVTDTDLIFTHTYDGVPLRPNTVSRAWEHIAKKAEVKVIRFHHARHTHASLMLQQGVPLKVVSERLGHSSISVTADVYAHIIPGMQENAAQRFDDAFTTKYNELVVSRNNSLESR